ncbi:MAG: hypothetical protein ACREBR_05265 [bacterium]
MSEITPDVIVYLACRMTGRSKAVMRKEAEEAVTTLSKHGITCISPVLEENVEGTPEILVAVSEELLREEWKKDKDFVKKCHVVLDLSAASRIRSEGATHEYMFARYALFKPVVRLFPNGLGFSIARLEDATIVQTLDEAAIAIVSKWGTRGRRIHWRIEEQIFWKWLKLLRLQFFGLFR